MPTSCSFLPLLSLYLNTQNGGRSRFLQKDHMLFYPVRIFAVKTSETSALSIDFHHHKFLSLLIETVFLLSKLYSNLLWIKTNAPIDVSISFFTAYQPSNTLSLLFRKTSILWLHIFFLYYCSGNTIPKSHSS